MKSTKWVATMVHRTFVIRSLPLMHSCLWNNLFCQELLEIRAKEKESVRQVVGREEGREHQEKKSNSTSSRHKGGSTSVGTSEGVNRSRQKSLSSSLSSAGEDDMPSSSDYKFGREG